MKPENAIEVHDLEKSFKVFYDKSNNLKERAIFLKRNRHENRQVIKGISFDVKKGEAVGLIGHNGCGKSTMLKLLNRIIYPDKGTIEMTGRVSSLIELGAGFHPDMSGRENIYTNAAIFGLKKKEIDERIDDIIEFSEIEEFIDNPVRTYSSGMYMRLAFSIAINVNADILLIDEILAVGDAGFQSKCFNKLQEIKAAGTTIVIVSHSVEQIEKICNRSIWINDGIIQGDGNPRAINLSYLRFLMKEKEKKEKKRKSESSTRDQSYDIESDEVNISTKNDNQIVDYSERCGNGKARVSTIEMFKIDGEARGVFTTGERVVLRVYYDVFETLKDVIIGVKFDSIDGVLIYGTNTHLDGITISELSQRGKVDFLIDDLAVLPGMYSVDVAISSGQGVMIEYYRKAFTFTVQSEISDIGIARLSHRWGIDDLS